MIISSSNETYTSQQGTAVLQPVATHVDPVVQQLRSQHVIISASSEEERRVPGRNFSFDDKSVSFISHLLLSSRTERTV